MPKASGELPISPDQLEEWKAKFGQVYELRGTVEQEDGSEREIVVIVRAPGRVQLGRFAKEVQKDTVKAIRTMVFECLLWPSADELDRLLAEKPGLIVALGGELQSLIGTNVDFTSRRL